MPSEALGHVTFVSGTLSLTGQSPYGLPTTITPEFIVALFSTPPGADPLFIANLAPGLVPEDRNRLYLAAKAYGGTAYAVYRNNALKWRWLLNNDGEWHPENYQFVYQVDVGASFECQYIDHISISSRGLRLVKTPVGWRSFPEFEHTYGESVLDHLTKAMDIIRKRAEARCAALTSILPHVTSEVVIKTLGVYTEGKGLEQRRVAGLASIPTADWKLPEGVSYAFEDA